MLAAARAGQILCDQPCSQKLLNPSKLQAYIHAEEIMTEPNGIEKPDGAAFDDFFESLGKKAEHLSVKEAAPKLNDLPATANATETRANTSASTDDAEDQRVVDEIESLCMNCHENVGCRQSSSGRDGAKCFDEGNHAAPTHSNTILPRDYSHVILLSTLQLQELRNTIRWRDTAKGFQI